MTAEEYAKSLLKQHNLAHVIYGYRADGKTVITNCKADMMRFDDDESYVAYIDWLQIANPNIEMIFAVHA